MVTTVHEYGHAGGFILSEAPGQLSRENVTLLSGEVVKAGAVLKLSSTKYVAFDGTGTAVAVSINSVDASAGDKLIAVIRRNAEVNGYELQFPAASPPVDSDTAVAGLLAEKIIVRWGSTPHPGA
jgi:hypothetical protein